MSACPSGKIQHATREAALDHQKALAYKNHLAGQSEKSAGLNVYLCGDCAAWHVGHSYEERPPLVYHYTIAKYLERILDADELRPRHPNAPSVAIGEPCPLLWFSWNQQWEQSVTKDTRHPAFRKAPPNGRAITELVGEGLIRFGAPASVAKLRWNDYLALNPMPSVQREQMAQRGNPVEWLATTKPVPLSKCDVYEIYYRGQWVAGETLPPEVATDDGWNRYLTERAEAYQAAWYRLKEKVGPETLETLEIGQPADDAEAILLNDLNAECRWDEWAVTHRAEIAAWCEAHRVEIERYRRTGRTNPRQRVRKRKRSPALMTKG